MNVYIEVQFQTRLLRLDTGYTPISVTVYLHLCLTYTPMSVTVYSPLRLTQVRGHVLESLYKTGKKDKNPTLVCVFWYLGWRILVSFLTGQGTSTRLEQDGGRYSLNNIKRSRNLVKCSQESHPEVL